MARARPLFFLGGSRARSGGAPQVRVRVEEAREEVRRVLGRAVELEARLAREGDARDRHAGHAGDRRLVGREFQETDGGDVEIRRGPEDGLGPGPGEENNLAGVAHVVDDDRGLVGAEAVARALAEPLGVRLGRVAAADDVKPGGADVDDRELGRDAPRLGRERVREAAVALGLGADVRQARVEELEPLVSERRPSPRRRERRKKKTRAGRTRPGPSRRSC